MCSPDNSVKLWREYEENRKQFQDFEVLYEVARDLYEKPKKPESVENWIAVSPEIISLNISGGEPSMLKGVQQYLEAFHAKGFSKNVTLTFNTNGTRPN
jgi:organic radical activating enzyme